MAFVLRMFGKVVCTAGAADHGKSNKRRRVANDHDGWMPSPSSAVFKSTTFVIY
jgi:hypothetical protein